MGKHMKENIRMVKRMDMENINILMDQSIKDVGFKM